MKATVLTDLLGKSILSEDLNSFMAGADLPTKPALRLDFAGNAYSTNSDNKSKGINLTFDGYYRYKQEYGEPGKRYSTSKDELFLVEITIDTEFVKTKKASPVDLPFGLQLGDDDKTVLQKLGKKPYDKSTASYGHCWWAQFDEFRILTALNPELKLIWVRLMKLTEDEKEKVRLKKELSQQNKNINPANANTILQYASKLPTKQWQQRMQEGDDSFSTKGITAIENLLKDYLQTLAALTNEKKASSIYNSVKKIVLAVNKINDKNEGFIETLEREELCKFINDVVRETGLDIDGSIDLTEQWREW